MMCTMSGLADYLGGFAEDPGYLDFARFGPISRAVAGEADAQQELLMRGRPGVLDRLGGGADRLRAAAARVTGFRNDQIVFQPSATQGLNQAVLGVSGGILMSPREVPSLPTSAVRASEALRATAPIWLDTDHGRVTPGAIRDHLTSTTTAVALSVVDPRTGYLVDIEGVRQVIGDRLLIIDATQGLGVVDAPWAAADVVACGGSAWLRAGFGTAFLAVSDRAAGRLTPVLSGPGGFPEGAPEWDAVPAPAGGAAGFQLGRPDQVAAARLAVALEEVADAGLPAIAARIRDAVGRVIALADEFAVPLASPRAEAERAGIVVLDPPPEHLTATTVALVNQGVSATVQGGRIRIAPHAGTTDETLGLLRSALLAASLAVRPLRR